MSRFHFDESAVETVMSSFCGIMQNIRDCANALNNISMELCDYEGFNIGYAIESINDEKNVKFRICANTLESGYNVLDLIRERVCFYDSFAFSSQYINCESIPDGFGNEFEFYGIGKYINSVNDSDVFLALGLNSFGYLGDFLSGLIGGKGLSGIEYKNAKVAIEMILKNLSDNIIEVPDDEEGDVIKEICRNLNAGKNIDDIMDSKAFDDSAKKFLNGISEFIDVKDLSEDILVDWYSDYSQAIKYLDSLEKFAADSDIAADVINELKIEYSNKYWQSVKTILDTAVEEAGKEAPKAVLKIASKTLGTVYSLDKFVLDVTAELTGADDLKDSYNTLNGLVIFEGEASQSYQKSAEKIASGNFTKADVEDYSRLFELNKSLKISEYETLISINKEKIKLANNPIVHSDYINSDRKNAAIKSLQNEISEYESKLSEIREMKNPIK